MRVPSFEGPVIGVKYLPRNNVSGYIGTVISVHGPSYIREVCAACWKGVEA